MKNKLTYILGEASTKTHMKYNVEFLQELGQDIEIYLILEKGTAVEFEKNWGKKPLQYFGQNVKVIFLNSNYSVLRIFKTFYHLLKSYFLGFRIIYVHYSFVGAILASLSSPFAKVYYWNCGMPMSYKRPFFQELYESLTYKLIDHFVTGAEILIPQYATFYNFNPKKGIVIPNWIDIKKFREKFEIVNIGDQKLKLKKELDLFRPDGGENKILFFNQRLAERKGAHYIPQILEFLRDEGIQDVLMIITNDGPYKEKLLEILKEKKLDNKVRLLGKVPNDKVTEILSVTDLYILPSEEEGMSHSLMEAMSASVAAVSFDVGGTKEMYPENFANFVVPVKDINSFNQKIKRLLGNYEERKALGKALFKQVKKYDKQIVLADFKQKVLYTK